MSRLLYVFAAILLVSETALSAVPSCPMVVANLTPCIDYLKGKDPTIICCAGVKNLKGMMKTKDDKLAVCKCSKDALKSFTYDPKIIPALPKKCGVTLALPPIDKNYDCSKIKLDESSSRVLLEDGGVDS